MGKTENNGEACFGRTATCVLSEQQYAQEGRRYPTKGVQSQCGYFYAVLGAGLLLVILFCSPRLAKLGHLFLQGMQRGVDDHVRQMSIVLLRRYLIGNLTPKEGLKGKGLWPRATQSSRNAIQQSLLQLLEIEDNHSLRRKVKKSFVFRELRVCICRSTRTLNDKKYSNNCHSG